jgi:aromatic-amino-acid transaminase
MDAFVETHLPPIVQKDSILGLAETFKEDMRVEKIDLLAGILKKKGKVSLFDSVKQSQKLYLESQAHKNYLPIVGEVEFLHSLKALIWSEKNNRSPSIQIQTLGATGALYLSAKLAMGMGYQTVILSSPSWPNHARLFKEAGMNIQRYDHSFKKAFTSLKEVLEKSQKPVLVLLQPLCHNPTGHDFSFEEISEIFDICEKKRHLIHFDVPYLGLKQSFEKDAQFIRDLTACAKNWLLSYSCAKNMTLYGERLGALYGSFTASSFKGQFDLDRIESYLVHLARSIYSNPPLNGSGIASLLFKSPSLKCLWLKELEEARLDLQEKRTLLGSFFQKYGFIAWTEEISFQSGMFGYFPLSIEKATLIQKEYAIYLPLEGRVNLSSLDPLSCKRLMESLIRVGALDEIK